MSDPDQACGREHGLTRAFISDQFVYNFATPLKSNLVNSKSPTLKLTNQPSQHSVLDYHRPASKTPFQWSFARRLIVTCFVYCQKT